MRPVATYSIVARQDDTIGVAVQSHWYNVGAVVPWVDASVGAVAVQSFSGPEYGPNALDALRQGERRLRVRKEASPSFASRAPSSRRARSRGWSTRSRTRSLVWVRSSSCSRTRMSPK